MITQHEARVLGRYLQRLGRQLENGAYLIGKVINGPELFNLSIDISAVGMAVRAEQDVVEVLDDAGKKELVG